jgi:hypothetical protein
MTARNIEIILGGLADAVPTRAGAMAAAGGSTTNWRYAASPRRGGPPTTAVLPRCGAPSPIAGGRNEIIGPERKEEIWQRSYRSNLNTRSSSPSTTRTGSLAG